MSLSTVRNMDPLAPRERLPKPAQQWRTCPEDPSRLIKPKAIRGTSTALQEAASSEGSVQEPVVSASCSAGPPHQRGEGSVSSNGAQGRSADVGFIHPFLPDNDPFDDDLLNQAILDDEDEGEDRQLDRKGSSFANGRETEMSSGSNYCSDERTSAIADPGSPRSGSGQELPCGGEHESVEPAPVCNICRCIPVPLDMDVVECCRRTLAQSRKLQGSASGSEDSPPASCRPGPTPSLCGDTLWSPATSRDFHRMALSTLKKNSSNNSSGRMEAYCQCVEVKQVYQPTWPQLAILSDFLSTSTPASSRQRRSQHSDLPGLDEAPVSIPENSPNAGAEDKSSENTQGSVVKSSDSEEYFTPPDGRVVADQKSSSLPEAPDACGGQSELERTNESLNCAEGKLEEDSSGWDCIHCLETRYYSEFPSQPKFEDAGEPQQRFSEDENTTEELDSYEQLEARAEFVDVSGGQDESESTDASLNCADGTLEMDSSYCYDSRYQATRCYGEFPSQPESEDTGEPELQFSEDEKTMEETDSYERLEQRAEFVELETDSSSNMEGTNLRYEMNDEENSCDCGDCEEVRNCKEVMTRFRGEQSEEDEEWQVDGLSEQFEEPADFVSSPEYESSQHEEDTCELEACDSFDYAEGTFHEDTPGEDNIPKCECTICAGQRHYDESSASSSGQSKGGGEVADPELPFADNSEAAVYPDLSEQHRDELSAPVDSPDRESKKILWKMGSRSSKPESETARGAAWSSSGDQENAKAATERGVENSLTYADVTGAGVKSDTVLLKSEQNPTYWRSVRRPSFSAPQDTTLQPHQCSSLGYVQPSRVRISWSADRASAFRPVKPAYLKGLPMNCVPRHQRLSGTPAVSPISLHPDDADLVGEVSRLLGPQPPRSVCKETLVWGGHGVPPSYLDSKKKRIVDFVRTSTPIDILTSRGHGSLLQTWNGVACGETSGKEGQGEALHSASQGGHVPDCQSRPDKDSQCMMKRERDETGIQAKKSPSLISLVRTSPHLPRMEHRVESRDGQDSRQCANSSSTVALSDANKARDVDGSNLSPQRKVLRLGKEQSSRDNSEMFFLDLPKRDLLGTHKHFEMALRYVGEMIHDKGTQTDPEEACKEDAGVQTEWEAWTATTHCRRCARESLAALDAASLSGDDEAAGGADFSPRDGSRLGSSDSDDFGLCTISPEKVCAPRNSASTQTDPEFLQGLGPLSNSLPTSGLFHSEACAQGQSSTVTSRKETTPPGGVATSCASPIQSTDAFFTGRGTDITLQEVLELLSPYADGGHIPSGFVMRLADLVMDEIRTRRPRDAPWTRDRVTPRERDHVQVSDSFFGKGVSDDSAECIRGGWGEKAWEGPDGVDDEGEEDCLDEDAIEEDALRDDDDQRLMVGDEWRYFNQTPQNRQGLDTSRSVENDACARNRYDQGRETARSVDVNVSRNCGRGQDPSQQEMATYDPFLNGFPALNASQSHADMSTSDIRRSGLAEQDSAALCRGDQRAPSQTDWYTTALRAPGIPKYFHPRMSPRPASVLLPQQTAWPLDDPCRQNVCAHASVSGPQASSSGGARDACLHREGEARQDLGEPWRRAWDACSWYWGQCRDPGFPPEEQDRCGNARMTPSSSATDFSAVRHEERLALEGGGRELETPRARLASCGGRDDFSPEILDACTSDSHQVPDVWNSQGDMDPSAGPMTASGYDVDIRACQRPLGLEPEPARRYTRPTFCQWWNPGWYQQHPNNYPQRNPEGGFRPDLQGGFPPNQYQGAATWGQGACALQDGTDSSYQPGNIDPYSLGTSTPTAHPAEAGERRGDQLPDDSQHGAVAEVARHRPASQASSTYLFLQPRSCPEGEFLHDHHPMDCSFCLNASQSRSDCHPGAPRDLTGNAQEMWYYRDPYEVHTERGQTYDAYHPTCAHYRAQEAWPLAPQPEPAAVRSLQNAPEQDRYHFQPESAASLCSGARRHTLDWCLSQRGQAGACQDAGSCLLPWGQAGHDASSTQRGWTPPQAWSRRAVGGSPGMRFHSRHVAAEEEEEAQRLIQSWSQDASFCSCSAGCTNQSGSEVRMSQGRPRCICSHGHVGEECRGQTALEEDDLYRRFHSILPAEFPGSYLHFEKEDNGILDKVVGKGSFGRVLLARVCLKPGTSTQVAVKEFYRDKSEAKDIYHEARVQLYLQDTGYVPYVHGVANMTTSAQAIVMEYFGDGLNLERFLWEKNSVSSKRWLNVARQLAQGLSFIHQRQIILNDIKTNNVLVDASSPDVRIKYIDMGMATFKVGMTYYYSPSLEDYLHLAPEVRKGARTSKASDVYSLGYVLDEIRAFTGLELLVPVIDACLAKEPEDRVQACCAHTLLEDLYADECIRFIASANQG